MQTITLTTIFMLGMLAPALAQLPCTPYPNNPYGIHVLEQDILTEKYIEEAVMWSRNLVGQWGYIKIMIYPITTDRTGADESWKTLLRRCGEENLIPLLRMDEYLGNKSPDTPDGTYGDIAQAYAAVARDLLEAYEPDKPMYFEIRNEPNNACEWSNAPNPEEYGKFFVAVSKAIREIGDPRAQVCNGALSPGGSYDNLKFTFEMAQIPGFAEHLDCWCSHTYPGNMPPEVNLHDGTSDSAIIPIDAYVSELVQLASAGVEVSALRVLIAEMAYTAGAQGGQWPTLDEGMATEYLVRAWRDYWSQWPELLTVTPFFMRDVWNPTRQPHLWVASDSGTDDQGRPTDAFEKYWAVYHLAKPYDLTGSLSGVVWDRYGNPLAEAEVALPELGVATTTNSAGFYILSAIPPGIHLAVAECANYSATERTPLFHQGRNTKLDFALDPLLDVGELAGTITDSKTDQPLADVNIQLHPRMVFRQTDESGQFRMRGIFSGQHEFLVTKPGYDPVRVSGVERKPHQQTSIEVSLVANLINNGGLEPLTAGTTSIPIHWSAGTVASPAHGDENRYWLDPTIKYAGMTSMRIELVDAEKHEGIWQFSGYTATAPGEKYQAEAVIRTQALQAPEGLGARLVVNLYTDDMEHLEEFSSEALAGDHDWTRVTVPVEVTVGGRWQVILEARGNSGSAFFDEVNLRRVTQ